MCWALLYRARIHVGVLELHTHGNSRSDKSDLRTTTWVIDSMDVLCYMSPRIGWLDSFCICSNVGTCTCTYNESFRSEWLREGEEEEESAEITWLWWFWPQDRQKNRQHASECGAFYKSSIRTRPSISAVWTATRLRPCRCLSLFVVNCFHFSECRSHEQKWNY